MRKAVPPDSPARQIVDDEVGILRRVHALLARDGEPAQGGPTASDFERDLIALRDQLADEKPEYLPSLVEQMTRVQALASGRRGGKATLPIDAASPYFAHMRLRAEGKTGEPPREQRVHAPEHAGLVVDDGARGRIRWDRLSHERISIMHRHRGARGRG